MSKRLICGAFMIAALCGTGTTQAQADELYIRNRPFKDVYFSGGSAYVPVDGFLKAIRVPWSTTGNMVTVGSGSSPALVSGDEMVTLVRGGESTQLSGIIRNGKLYVNSKEIAKATGYGLIYNRATGVFDVVKSRFTNESDEKAAAEVVAANEAAEAKRDAAWQARVEKARAARKAKEEAENAADDEDSDSLDEDTDEDLGDEDMADATDSDSSKDMDEDEDEDEDEDFDTTDKSSDASTADTSDPDEGEPKKADLVVISTDAAPNLYNGEVKFSAVLQNQGYADATNVKARFVAVGPDGKTWVSKTLFHGDMAPDGRWVITEDYRHRLKGAAPRGEFKVTVTPEFDSAAPKK